MDHQQIEFFSADEPSPMAVVAGTLCLMSCALQSRPNLYIGKLIDNFNYLANHAAIDPTIRSVCRRMACHWESEAVARRISDHSDGECPTCATENAKDYTNDRTKDRTDIAGQTLPAPFTEAQAADYVRDALMQIATGRSPSR
jgi:hypothetical protein